MEAAARAEQLRETKSAVHFTAFIDRLQREEVARLAHLEDLRRQAASAVGIQGLFRRRRARLETARRRAERDLKRATAAELERARRAKEEKLRRAEEARRNRKEVDLVRVRCCVAWRGVAGRACVPQYA